MNNWGDGSVWQRDKTLGRRLLAFPSAHLQEEKLEKKDKNNTGA